MLKPHFLVKLAIAAKIVIQPKKQASEVLIALMAAMVLLSAFLIVGILTGSTTG
jgi:hypothetical protein